MKPPKPTKIKKKGKELAVHNTAALAPPAGGHFLKIIYNATTLY